MLKEANEQREAAENLVNIKQFLIEAKQQELDAKQDEMMEIQTELHSKEQVIDLQEVVINEKLDEIKDKEAALKVNENTIEILEQNLGKKQTARDIWASTHAVTVLKMNEPEATLPFYIMRTQNKTMVRNLKKIYKQAPNIGGILETK